jgi:hypothetical protein
VSVVAETTAISTVPLSGSMTLGKTPEGLGCSTYMLPDGPGPGRASRSSLQEQYRDMAVLEFRPSPSSHRALGLTRASPRALVY